ERRLPPRQAAPEGSREQATRRGEDAARTDRPHARRTGRLAALHPLLVQPLAQQVDPVAAPEQFALEDEGRHAEDTRGLGLLAQPVMLGATLARQESGEARRRASLGKQR